jgi:hypothetical protein
LGRYELVKNPKALARLEAELDAAGLLVTPERPTPRPFTFADIHLPYLQAVVKVPALSLQPHLAQALGCVRYKYGQMQVGL